jgi:hypothetical protein
MASPVLQKADYTNGVRTNPDKVRQLYKMYQALILTEIVDETPLEKIVELFFPQDSGMKDTRVARHEREIQQLQVRGTACHRQHVVHHVISWLRFISPDRCL